MEQPVKPRWRWWLFCACNALDVRFGWRWARAAWAWSIRGEWLGDSNDIGDGFGEPPF